MIGRLVDLSVKHARIVVAATAVFALVAGYVGFGLELDALPDVTTNQVLVLTRAPGAFAARDVLALREAGLSDLEILDMLHSAALFGWANRLMLNLGVEIWPQAA